MMEKIRVFFVINGKKIIYYILFIVLFFIILIISFLDTYSTYNILSFTDYWILSFVKVLSETFTISILITVIFQYLNKIAKENVQKENIWNKIFEEQILEINDLSEKLTQRGKDNKNTEFYEAGKELKKISEEFERINPLKIGVGRKVRKLSKRLFKVSSDLFD